MKIALLSRWYWEENRRHTDDVEGGPTRQLAEAVAALGHEVVVLSQSPEAKKLKKAQVGALETWLSPRDKRRSFWTGLRDKWGKKTYSHRKVYSDALALRDFLKRRGPFDVLWAQTESPDGLVAGIAARRGVKLPPVLLQIQALRYRFENGTPVFTEKEALGLAFRQATRILANSEMIAATLLQYAADLQGKIHVVYPNLQRSFLQAAQQNPAKPLPMKDRVLFLGALNEGKGAIDFLKAIPKTEVAKRNAIFAVIGAFTEHNKAFRKLWDETKAATRAQIRYPRMEYLGKVDAAEVIRQIRLARVVVVPSLFDAFSRALVEALLLGRPVVTTDKVGAAPLVQKHQCGVVVAPHDPDSLARAIDVVLSRIVPFARNALQLGPRLLDEFSPETIAAQIARHLSEISNQTGGT